MTTAAASPGSMTRFQHHHSHARGDREPLDADVERKPAVQPATP
jgi:hypothetical protein